MGYYADGSGYITFIAPTKQEIEKIESVLSDVFEVSRETELKHRGASSANFTFSVYDGNKYYGDDVQETLDEVSKICPISEGEIEYAGEDYCHWRFIYHPDLGWVEQNGRVEYDPLPEVNREAQPPN